jgi:dTDP-4-amino-4,6-dideoxygalactose transaminase
MTTEPTYRIYLSPPNITAWEKQYVQQALDDNWIAPGGPFVARFEEKIKMATSRRHVVATNSGTSALHLALLALGVGAGDEVICQTFTFAATAFPILYVGASPVFVDSEDQTWNIDPDLLRKAIEARMAKSNRLKAIIYVHAYGVPAHTGMLAEIAGEYGIPLIEDAAEAFGSRCGRQPAGSIGRVSILSFNGNKIATTGGGGALLTDDEELASRAAFLANQAKSAQTYHHTEVGYNYRMTGLAAALGLGQLAHHADDVQARKAIFHRYMSGLQVDKSALVNNEYLEQSNAWLFSFLCRDGASRDALIHALAKAGIESRTTWKPLHTQPVFQSASRYLNGISDELFARGICLPTGAGLTIDEQREIIRVVNENF